MRRGARESAGVFAVVLGLLVGLLVAAVDSHRTLRWESRCRCWKAAGAFEPLYVP